LKEAEKEEGHKLKIHNKKAEKLIHVLNLG
jgi:hypothetical protein